jgi:alcohol dehydrogenase (cytochrome c)
MAVNNDQLQSSDKGTLADPFDRALVHPGRNGYLWTLERGADAIDFIDAEPFVYQDVFTSLDPETGRPTYDEDNKPGTGKLAAFCPSLWGGKDWPPAAYNPMTGLLYIPANDNLCGTSVGEEVVYRPGSSFTGADAEMTLGADARTIGELQAWDMNTGEEVWTHTFASNNWGPVLTTAGGLVFMGGTADRYFRAFDVRTGEVLWETRLGAPAHGYPISYASGGKQYIAVPTGLGIFRTITAALNPEIYQPGTGNALYVFELPDN